MLTMHMRMRPRLHYTRRRLQLPRPAWTKGGLKIDELVGCRSVTRQIQLQSSFTLPVAPFQYGASVRLGHHAQWSGTVWDNINGRASLTAQVVQPNEEILREWAELTAGPLHVHLPSCLTQPLFLPESRRFTS